MRPWCARQSRSTGGGWPLGLPAELLRDLQSVAGGGAPPAPAAPVEADPAAVAAPIAGSLQAWKVADGDTVAQGDTIATMEAMKMEMQVTAHRAGRIALNAERGAHVAAGVVIATIAEPRQLPRNRGCEPESPLTQRLQKSRNTSGISTAASTTCMPSASPA